LAIFDYKTQAPVMDAFFNKLLNKK